MAYSIFCKLCKKLKHKRWWEGYKKRHEELTRIKKEYNKYIRLLQKANKLEEKQKKKLEIEKQKSRKIICGYVGIGRRHGLRLIQRINTVYINAKTEDLEYIINRLKK